MSTNLPPLVENVAHFADVLDVLLSSERLGLRTKSIL
jgi:hypothetical protein